MTYGVALNIGGSHRGIRSNPVKDQVELAVLGAQLGFDSVFVLEHHLTDYVVSPAPMELMAFIAGRAPGMLVGAAVIVLPWHDPVRLAGQIAVLDALTGGRYAIAFGRGASRTEYAGLGVPIEESRERFVRTLEAVISLLSEPDVTLSGHYFGDRSVELRPGLVHTLDGRLFIASSSPEALKIAAQRGIGLALTASHAWTELVSATTQFEQLAATSGSIRPPGPLVSVMVSVDEDPATARDRAVRFAGRDLILLDDHYGYSDLELARIPGYESYVNTCNFFSRLRSDSDFFTHSVEELVLRQIVGTPSQCVSQVRSLESLLSPSHLAFEFSFGGMALEESMRQLDLFANRVLPYLRCAQPDRLAPTTSWE